MVISESHFLIDAAFIVERTHKTFFGAPLLTTGGKDHTFTFGCVRQFVRLRQNFGIKSGVMILGRETYSLSSQSNILDLIILLKELKIPYVHDPLSSALQLIGRMRSGFTHIVTFDRIFLQFCTNDLFVVLPKGGKQADWDCMSPEAVKTMMGIAPQAVPTYLAMTDPSSSAALTSQQAIRLIELYGNIDSIYANRDLLVSVQIRKKLANSESSIRQCYDKIRYDPVSNQMCKSAENSSLNKFDTTEIRQVLMRYGFHSLLRLLVTPLDVKTSSWGHEPSSKSYHIVVDHEQLKKLESVVLASKLCSIDTESDDKDPRDATLLGISFSIKAGEAYFIPLIETDLKGLTSNDVLKVLKRIFSADVDFIGPTLNMIPLCFGG